MSLAELKAKIVSDAEAEAKGIMEEADKEAQKIVEQAESQVQVLRAQIDKDAQRMAQERFQNIVTLARVSGRNLVLAAKQKMVNEVFEEAKKRLKSLSPQQFRQMAHRLLFNHPPKQDTLLMVGKKNREMIDESFVDRINKELKSPGKFILTESNRDFDYGMILVTDWVEIDITFDGILASIREEIEMNVIKTLFGRG